MAVSITNADKSVTKLEKDVDYTVTYKNNTKAGRATATVKGISKFNGTVTKTYTIKAFDLAAKENEAKLDGNINDKIVAKFDKNGSKPEITLTVCGNTLVAG